MKGLIALFVGVSLVGCTASEQAMLNPEASYVNRQKVTAIPAGQGITVVGSYQDEMGNSMEAYPAPELKAHKIVHIYPVPSQVFVECHKENSHYVGSQLVTTQKTGMGYAKTNFQAGKTYMVFCNIQAGNRYHISVKEVPNGTRFGNRAYHDKKKQSAAPTDANRVRFTISTKKSSQDWTRLAGGNYMAIRNWDGKLGREAELALPIEKVEVECQSRRQTVIVPLVGKFQAGKTYQLGCRTDSQGKFEAYVVNER